MPTGFPRAQEPTFRQDSPGAYIPHLETRLYIDHGPEGIASTVAQLYKEGNNPGWKVVHHKSRSLITAERNYTKPEGESLAIYSRIKMNRQYLNGTP